MRSPLACWRPRTPLPARATRRLARYLLGARPAPSSVTPAPTAGGETAHEIPKIVGPQARGSAALHGRSAGSQDGSPPVPVKFPGTIPDADRHGNLGSLWTRPPRMSGGYARKSLAPLQQMPAARPTVYGDQSRPLLGASQASDSQPLRPSDEDAHEPPSTSSGGRQSFDILSVGRPPKPQSGSAAAKPRPGANRTGTPTSASCWSAPMPPHPVSAGGVVKRAVPCRSSGRRNWRVWARGAARQGDERETAVGLERPRNACQRCRGCLPSIGSLISSPAVVPGPWHAGGPRGACPNRMTGRRTGEMPKA